MNLEHSENVNVCIISNRDHLAFLRQINNIDGVIIDVKYSTAIDRGGFLVHTALIFYKARRRSK